MFKDDVPNQFPNVQAQFMGTARPITASDALARLQTLKDSAGMTHLDAYIMLCKTFGASNLPAYETTL